MNKKQYTTPLTSLYELRMEGTLLSLSDGNGANVQSNNVQTLGSSDIASGEETGW